MAEEEILFLIGVDEAQGTSSAIAQLVAEVESAHAKIRKSAEEAFALPTMRISDESLASVQSSIADAAKKSYASISEAAEKTHQDEMRYASASAAKRIETYQEAADKRVEIAMAMADAVIAEEKRIQEARSKPSGDAQASTPQPSQATPASAPETPQPNIDVNGLGADVAKAYEAMAVAAETSASRQREAIGTIAAAISSSLETIGQGKAAMEGLAASVKEAFANIPPFEIPDLVAPKVQVDEEATRAAFGKIAEIASQTNELITQSASESSKKQLDILNATIAQKVDAFQSGADKRVEIAMAMADAIIVEEKRLQEMREKSIASQGKPMEQPTENRDANATLPETGVQASTQVTVDYGKMADEARQAYESIGAAASAASDRQIAAAKAASDAIDGGMGSLERSKAAIADFVTSVEEAFSQLKDTEQPTFAMPKMQGTSDEVSGVYSSITNSAKQAYSAISDIAKESNEKEVAFAEAAIAKRTELYQQAADQRVEQAMAVVDAIIAEENRLLELRQKTNSSDVQAGSQESPTPQASPQSVQPTDSAAVGKIAAEYESVGVAAKAVFQGIAAESASAAAAQVEAAQSVSAAITANIEAVELHKAAIIALAEQASAAYASMRDAAAQSFELPKQNTSDDSDNQKRDQALASARETYKQIVKAAEEASVAEVGLVAMSTANRVTLYQEGADKAIAIAKTMVDAIIAEENRLGSTSGAAPTPSSDSPDSSGEADKAKQTADNVTSEYARIGAAGAETYQTVAQEAEKAAVTQSEIGKAIASSIVSGLSGINEVKQAITDLVAGVQTASDQIRQSADEAMKLTKGEQAGGGDAAQVRADAVSSVTASYMEIAKVAEQVHLAEIGFAAMSSNKRVELAQEAADKRAAITSQMVMSILEQEQKLATAKSEPAPQQQVGDEKIDSAQESARRQVHYAKWTADEVIKEYERIGFEGSKAYRAIAAEAEQAAARQVNSAKAVAAALLQDSQEAAQAIAANAQKSAGEMVAMTSKIGGEHEKSADAATESYGRLGAAIQFLRKFIGSQEGAEEIVEQAAQARTEGAEGAIIMAEAVGKASAALSEEAKLANEAAEAHAKLNAERGKASGGVSGGEGPANVGGATSGTPAAVVDGKQAVDAAKGMADRVTQEYNRIGAAAESVYSEASGQAAAAAGQQAASSAAVADAAEESYVQAEAVVVDSTTQAVKAWMEANGHYNNAVEEISASTSKMSSRIDSSSKQSAASLRKTEIAMDNAMKSMLTGKVTADEFADEVERVAATLDKQTAALLKDNVALQAEKEAQEAVARGFTDVQQGSTMASQGLAKLGRAWALMGLSSGESSEQMVEQFAKIQATMDLVSGSIAGVSGAVEVFQGVQSILKGMKLAQAAATLAARSHAVASTQVTTALSAEAAAANSAAIAQGKLGVARKTTAMTGGISAAGSAVATAGAGAATAGGAAAAGGGAAAAGGGGLVGILGTLGFSGIAAVAGVAVGALSLLSAAVRDATDGMTEAERRAEKQFDDTGTFTDVFMSAGALGVSLLKATNVMGEFSESIVKGESFFDHLAERANDVGGAFQEYSESAGTGFTRLLNTIGNMTGAFDLVGDQMTWRMEAQRKELLEELKIKAEVKKIRLTAELEYADVVRKSAAMLRDFRDVGRQGPQDFGDGSAIKEQLSAAQERQTEARTRFESLDSTDTEFEQARQEWLAAEQEVYGLMLAQRREVHAIAEAKKQSALDDHRRAQERLDKEKEIAKQIDEMRMSAAERFGRMDRADQQAAIRARNALTQAGGDATQLSRREIEALESTGMPVGQEAARDYYADRAAQGGFNATFDQDFVQERQDRITALDQAEKERNVRLQAEHRVTVQIENQEAAIAGVMEPLIESVVARIEQLSEDVINDRRDQNIDNARNNGQNPATATRNQVGKVLSQ